MAKKENLYKVVHTTLIDGSMLTTGKVVQASDISKKGQKAFSSAVDDGSIKKIEAKAPETTEDEIFGDDDEGEDNDNIPDDLDEDDELPSDKEEEGDEIPVTDVKGIGEGTAKKLKPLGIETVEQLKSRIEDEEVKAVLANSYENVQNALEEL